MRVCLPEAIAGQPCSCAGVGASKVRSNQSRTGWLNRASASMASAYRAARGVTRGRSNRDAPVPPPAISVVRPGARELKRRLGFLGAAEIAGMDAGELDHVFRERPALHRFPGTMAQRTQDLCAAIVSE